MKLKYCFIGIIPNRKKVEPKVGDFVSRRVLQEMHKQSNTLGCDGQWDREMILMHQPGLWDVYVKEEDLWCETVIYFQIVVHTNL